MIAGVDDSGFDNNSMYSLFNLCIYLTDTGFHHLEDVNIFITYIIDILF